MARGSLLILAAACQLAAAQVPSKIVDTMHQSINLLLERDGLFHSKEEVYTLDELLRAAVREFPSKHLSDLRLLVAHNHWRGAVIRILDRFDGWQMEKIRLGLLTKFSTPPLRVGGNTQEARLFLKLKPRPMGRPGVVFLQVTINEEGLPVLIVTLRGHRGLNLEAVRTVWQYIYRPVILDGRPVPVIATVAVRFDR